MSLTNELRIFIGSTLIRSEYRRGRSLCRQRGIAFTEVDLRWGLTEEDVALGQVIRTCLEEIDQCRPYFIGITGDRYGFIPSFSFAMQDHWASSSTTT